MSVLILSHPMSHRHVTPPGHPERVERIVAVDAVLAEDAYAALPRAEAPAASRAELERAHKPSYVRSIEDAAPAEGFRALDPDTHMCPDSLEAGLRAAGSNVAAVEAVMRGDHLAAFAAVRPCGHHAERARAMGFCLFDNIAVGALHAIEALGAGKVAIMDFDVHHGNGTQDIFWKDDRVLFASTHQMPLYPGTGSVEETGVGNIVNAPLPPGAGGKEFRAAMERIVLPAMDDFEPDLVMISAGFDAHRRDPLANLAFEDEDFGWATARICEVAARHANGRVVSTLEGGYDLEGLAGGLRAHLDALVAHAG